MNRRSIKAVIAGVIGLIFVALQAQVVSAASGLVTDLQLTADRQAPQPDHTTIRWTATATGGKAPYTYKWWVFDGAWRVVQDWGKNANSFSWTPLVPNGGYQVRVAVRSSTNTTGVEEPSTVVAYPIQAAITAVTMTADRAAPQPVGSSITLSATATGGVAPVSFKWLLSDGVSWTVLRDWNTSATYVWTPTTANANYSVRVAARGAGLSGEAEQIRSMPYPIGPPRVTSLTLTPDRSSPRPEGATIRWTASAVGGTAPYSYKWSVYRGSWEVVQDWSTSPSYTWTPLTASNTYQIRVAARSSGAANDGEQSTSMGYVIQPAMKDVTLRSELSSPQRPGTSIRWVGVATGGVAPYSFKWAVFDGTSWTVLQDWSTSETFVWTPTLENAQYAVRVIARSAGLTGDGEQRKDAPFPIQITSSNPPPPGDGSPPGGGCTYSVMPSTITVGYDNGTSEVHVTTAPGCSWTAEVVRGGVVDYVTPTQGSGTAILSLAISNNTSPDPRVSDVVVAGHTVSVTQVATAPDSTCDYTLSSLLATIPVDGGSGTVDVSSRSTCTWGVNLSASWVHLTGNTAGTGSGSVSYVVDPNSGAPRNTTVLIAGRGFDILQEGMSQSPAPAPEPGSPPPPPPTDPGLTWNDVPVTTVDTESMVYRPYGPYIWESSPDTHAPALGECFGNCGAGCSGAVNPCGGRTQWWELQILTQPELIPGSEWQDVWCYGDTFYLYDFERYNAMGRWIYHGHSALGCVTHDSLCPEWTWLGCMVFVGCGTEWDQDWSYDDVVIASLAVNIQEIGTGACN